MVTISVGFSETLFQEISGDNQQECLLVAQDLASEGICVPQIWVDEKMSHVQLEINFQKRNFILTFYESSKGELSFLLSMSPYMRLIKEYRQICLAYQEALIKSHASAVETIDMARRGLHNQAATLIKERTDDKILTNHHACRALFTLMILTMPAHNSGLIS